MKWWRNVVARALNLVNFWPSSVTNHVEMAPKSRAKSLAHNRIFGLCDLHLCHVAS